MYPYCEQGRPDCLDQNCGCVDNPYYRLKYKQARGELVTAPKGTTSMLKFIVVLVLILGWSITVPFVLWADWKAEDWFLFGLDAIIATMIGEWLFYKMREANRDW